MTRTHGLIGLLLLTGASGCIIAEHSPGGTGGTGPGDSVDVFLELSYAGSPDCFASSVDEVSATFADGALTAANVPCNSAQGIAIEYQKVVPGTYTVTFEAMEQGTIVFGGTGTFTVDPQAGSPQFFSFDLPPYGGTTDGGTSTDAGTVADAGSSSDGGTVADAGTPDAGTGHDAGSSSSTTATLEFSFGGTSSTPGLTCAQAQVTNVSVTIDGATAMTVPCHDPSTLTDTATFDVTPGTHSFDLSVLDSTGTVLYHSTLSNQTIASGGNLIVADIAGATPGGLMLTWSFSGAATCQDAGVSFIEYVLTGPDQQEIAHDKAPCANADGSTASITFDKMTGYPLAAGEYTLSSISGINTNGDQVYPSKGPIDNLAVPAGITKSYTITLSK